MAKFSHVPVPHDVDADVGSDARAFHDVVDDDVVQPWVLSNYSPAVSRISHERGPGLDQGVWESTWGAAMAWRGS
jgi:hypothetical protein